MSISGRCGRLAGVAFLIGGVCLASARQSNNLTEYITDHPWDAVKSGPLIAVDPEHTRAKTKGANLLDFNRKLANAGRLWAIVPTEMVLIDDSLLESPNFYDGLPRHSKVLYLLSTLNQDQLKLANTVGIGLHDLRGEQTKVFKSIMPQTMGWVTHTFGQNGEVSKTVDGGTVPTDQMDQAKLRITSELSFNLGLANIRATTTVKPGEWYGKAGDTVTVRKEGFDEDSNFGLDFRKSVPNTTKPSQLNYLDSRFDLPVTLPAQSTVQDLVHAVGVTAGVEIHADIRVAGLNVRAFGPTARAGDLLKAIALCVTGTYRRVDSAYVLTSDLVGIGGRTLKFAAWRVNADKALYIREDSWRNQIGKTGAISKIGFDPNDPYAPVDRFRDFVNTDKQVASSDLTPAIRSFINQAAYHDSSNPLKTDQIGIVSEVKYGFVLPNGQALLPESQDLGQKWQFGVLSSPRAQKEEEVKVDPYPKSTAGRIRLVIHAENAPDAVAEANQAIVHGFTEIWLETHQPAALLACLKTGLRVRLVIRPWIAPPGLKAPFVDRDVLSDTGPQLGARRAAEPDWQHYEDLSSRSAGSSCPLCDLTSPLDPDLPKRWADLAALARTPGLSGVVVQDTQPIGYEALDSSIQMYPKCLAVLNELGYSDSLRLGFLRAQGVDPIDIAQPWLTIDFDLSQPFFRGPNLGHGENTPIANLIRDLSDRWFAYRSAQNAKAISGLTSLLNGINTPILVTPRASAAHMPPSSFLSVSPWSPGQKLPQISPDDNPKDDPSSITICTFNENTSLYALRYLAIFIRDPKGKWARDNWALDASSVKPEKLGPLLDRWFPRVGG